MCFILLIWQKAVVSEELDWILKFESDAPLQFPPLVWRRIQTSVKPFFQLDDHCKLKRPDVSLLLQKCVSMKTGPETIPFLDVLLLTSQGQQATQAKVAESLKFLATLVTEYSTDRYLILRILVLVKRLDGEIISNDDGLIAAVNKLIEETIDPMLKSHAIQVSAHLQASTIVSNIQIKTEEKKRKVLEEEFSEGESTKKLRSLKEYREHKKRAKEEKKDDKNFAFEKLLKDTVASQCVQKFGIGEGTELPEWRRVYRLVSALLMEKESRMPEDIRFRASTTDERNAVIKRVTAFCTNYLNNLP